MNTLILLRRPTSFQKWRYNHEQSFGSLRVMSGTSAKAQQSTPPNGAPSSKNLESEIRESNKERKAAFNLSLGVLTGLFTLFLYVIRTWSHYPSLMSTVSFIFSASTSSLAAFCSPDWSSTTSQNVEFLLYNYLTNMRQDPWTMAAGIQRHLTRPW